MDRRASFSEYFSERLLHDRLCSLGLFDVHLIGLRFDRIQGRFGDGPAARKRRSLRRFGRRRFGRARCCREKRRDDTCGDGCFLARVLLHDVPPLIASVDGDAI